MTIERVDDTLPGWVSVLVPAAQLAERIAGTEFVPRAMRGKPDVVTAAIMYGAELGLGPMQALAGIHVVEGHPQPSAELMRALILRAGHNFVVHEMTATRCRVSGLRAGRPEAERAYIEWTADMARQAGLQGRPPWRAYPRAMLLARATGDLARMLFPDVVKGLGYAAEAVDDLDAVESWPVESGPVDPGTTSPDDPGSTPELPQRKPRKSVTRERRPKVKDLPADRTPATEDNPAPDGSIDVPLPAVDGPEPEQPPVAPLPADRPDYLPEPDPDDPGGRPDLDPKTMRGIFASWRRIGMNGEQHRDRRLAITSAIVGRPIESTVNLTQREGLAVIRAINDLETGALVVEDDDDGKVMLWPREVEPPPDDNAP